MVLWPTTPIPQHVMDRFWSKVDKGFEDECWPYNEYCYPNGYGEFKHNSENYYAHRLAYALTNGPFELHMKVRHSCDNPPCCNPKHLLLGTMQDNVDDMARRGRKAIYSGFVRKDSEANASAKLTWPKVRELKARIAKKENLKKLAEEYSIHWSQVYRIKNGESWAE